MADTFTTTLSSIITALSITLMVGLVIYGLLYGAYLYRRLKLREKMSLTMRSFEIRVPKDNEIKIDAAEEMFSILSTYHDTKFWNFLGLDEVFAFELIAKQGEIRFVVTVPEHTADHIQKTIYAYYPQADIKEIEEPNIFDTKGVVEYAALSLKAAPHYPLKTYKDIPVDSLSALTSALSRIEEGEGAMVQVLVTSAPGNWRGAGKSFIATSKKDESTPDKATYKLDNKLIDKVDEKTNKPGFKAVVRIVVSAQTKHAAKQHATNIKNAFVQFTSSHNGFKKRTIYFKGLFMIDVLYKFFPLWEPPFLPKTVSVLTSEDLASLYHFPNKTVETPNIKWLKAKSAPVPTEVSEKEGTYIGIGYYRGVGRPVRIKLVDRRRHVYIIGKTGSGKSFLLQDMILQDIREGHGVCLLDPHGDLAENVLKFIPPERAQDVVYFDPADIENPMGVNILEHETEDQKHFVTEAVLNLLYKLYDPERTGIIGPRFEHAVRNCLLTIMADKGATLVELVRILTDENYMNELLPKVTDPIVRRYWTDQMAQTADFHKSEILDWLVSKFGKFVTNKLLRNIIGQSESSFDFRKIMDERKIIIVNLSKGRLGEENSQFLGVVLIPKFVAAAMSRANVPESQRPDFFLYVDEFQNFASRDFEVILSEARKYRLNLTVANQYIGQMEESIKNAIFGNIGTMMCYRTGVQDASFLAREFQPTFGEMDIMNAERYHLYVKTIVDNEPATPFSIDVTKDLSKAPKPNEELAQTIVALSRANYSRPRAEVEYEIIKRAKL